VIDYNGNWTRLAAGYEKIYLRPVGSISLDNDPELCYNISMIKDYTDEATGVAIPVGTIAHRVETALIPITAQMNNTSLRVNKETWRRNLAAMSDLLGKQNQACYDEAGYRFQTNSSADCAKLLFDKMGLEPLRKTATGKVSVDKETLLALEAQGCKIAGLIAQARESRAKLSQLEKWEEYANAGEVRATWLQFGTPMGRYSCEEPNLQNRILEVRETIEPLPGWTFVSVDQAQAEYVVWASLAKDTLLSETFLSGQDLHQRMINEIMSQIPDFQTAIREKDPRQYGKRTNFALLYLMQEWTLARDLGVSVEMARHIISAWNARAPQAAKYLQDYLAEFQKTGVAYTAFGRIRNLPIKEAKGHMKHELNKTAWHHHNAGTAAEILKIRQVRVMNNLVKAGFGSEVARCALQMHDELIVMCKDEIVPQVQAIMVEQFRREVAGYLPMRLTEKTGKTWLAVSKD